MRQGLLRENVRLGKMAVAFSFTSAVSQPFEKQILIYQLSDVRSV